MAVIRIWATTGLANFLHDIRLGHESSMFSEHLERQTIFALSTGLGKSAVAIVRVSGPHSSEILRKLCPGVHFSDRQATLARILDSETQLLDRGIVIRFFAPRSFTGEEMIEFQITGSRAIVSGLLRALGDCAGTRPANAGEFARRAFENGKLDLIEIEGLALVVEAETRLQLRQAAVMASGQLSRRCENLRLMVLRAIANVETLLDFSDVEDAPDISVSTVTSFVGEAIALLEDMSRNFDVWERIREGLTIVIAGEPNVGKSTLFNYFVGREAAIVSPIPGTTRDVLEVSLDLFGYPVTLVDTAGIRDTFDTIEAEGVARARKRSTNADLVLWLYDSEMVSTPDIGAAALLKVRTKADLRSLCPNTSGGVAISVKSGYGLDDLVSKIVEFAKISFRGFWQCGFWHGEATRSSSGRNGSVESSQR